MAARISAAAIARLHTAFAASAFLSALAIGSVLHFKKIVKNGVAQYPDEWFPSVSATIGDWYPERNIFQIFIALTAGPRFTIVFLQYFLHHSASSSLSTLVFLSGIIRTLSCGGWVYVTSSDDHDIHDFMMVLYMICNIPWMLVGIATTPRSCVSVIRKRKLIAGSFFATIVPLVYFFVQHKVHRISGAYTRYAFFEWGLIFFDVLYDSVSEQEFREAGLHISLVGLTDSKSTKTSVESRLKESLSSNESGSPKPNGENPGFSVPESVVHINANKTLPGAANSGLVPAPGRKIISTKAPSLPIPSWKYSLGFLSDIYLSYMFWSLFTSLIPTLFYFSVWKLGIAGHELALLSVLSPMLLALSSPHNYLFGSSQTPASVFNFTSTRRGQSILQLVSLIGALAYRVPSPSGRLVLVAIGNIIAVMRQVVTWSGIVRGDSDVGYQAIVTGLGVLISSLSKQANRSNNPVWPFINHKAGGLNKAGILLATLAIYEYMTRDVVLLPDLSTFEEKSSSESSIVRRKRPWLGALPLGSLLFCLHNLLSDSSTLVAWSWTGYENRLPRGPVPHLHGSLTISALAFGMLIGHLSSTNKKSKQILSHPLWFIFGAASSYVLYTYRNWTGYAGGLGVAIFLMSILPLGFQTASDASSCMNRATCDYKNLAVSKTYTIALAVYCVLNLVSVFTVAYAFVPGGGYFRERTDLVTFLQLACLLPIFNWPGLRSAPNNTLRAPLATKYKSHIRSTLALLPLLSLLITLYRLPRAPPRPFKSGPRIVNTGIWTVHFGIDNEGHDSQKGIMNLIRDMELDIVGLLETDLHRTAFGHRDLSRLIVEEMNYNVDTGPGPNSHTWGAVLLSKFPIINTTHHLLPSPHGELAPAIEAILDVYGTEVLVLVAHNGQEEDPLDRELQSTELAKILAASTRPVIFLGYVVTKPLMPRPHPYGIIVQEGNVHDVDVDDNDRWCEYIFYRGLYRTSYARISRGVITDTETQIAQFVLPRHGHRVSDDSFAARYRRSRKEELPVDHWFPMEYYGNEKQGGVGGHYYHVFNTPLYYKLPENAVV